jgi:hypothetical protein
MDDCITLPAWFIFILLLFAGVMVLDRLLMPGLRWYLRRRVNKVIDEVSSRLDIEIRPFQLTRRQSLIDQLVFDDKVIAEIKVYAAEHEMPTAVAQQKAKLYASEIVPAFNVYIYFRLGYWLARKFARLIYRIRVGFFDNNGLKKYPRASVGQANAGCRGIAAVARILREFNLALEIKSVSWVSFLSAYPLAIQVPCQGLAEFFYSRSSLGIVSVMADANRYRGCIFY